MNIIKHEIQYTKDYDQFNILKTNREINNTHLKKLISSMEKHYIPNPAFVDKKMRIRDGQHRFMACKFLNLPFAYIIVDMDDKDMININKYQKSWTATDYINHYANKGIRDYILLSDAMQMTGLQHQVLILFSNPKISRSSIPSIVRTGDLVFNEDTFYLNYHKYEEIIKNLGLKSLTTRSEILALIKGIFVHPDYDHSNMLHKCKNYGRANYYKCATYEQGLAMLEYIYNYKTRKENCINFVEFYKQKINE